MIYLCARLKPLLDADREILARRNVEINDGSILIPCSIKQGVDFGLVARFMVRGSECFLIRERQDQGDRGFRVGYFRIKQGRFVIIVLEAGKEEWHEQTIRINEFYSVFVHANGLVEILSIKPYKDTVTIRPIRPRNYLPLNDSDGMLYKLKKEGLNLSSFAFPSLVRYICLLARSIDENESYFDGRREYFDSDGETSKLRLVS